MERHLKAVSTHHKPGSFFFEETNGERIRIVATSSNDEQVKKAFYSLLGLFPPTLEILFKVKQEENGEQAKTESYHGIVKKELLENVIKMVESYVFQDARNEISIKNPAKSEYFTLDAHSVLYVYPESDKDDFENLLITAGFQRQDTGILVSDAPHWHIEIKEGKKQKDKIISKLGLKAIS